MGFWFWAIFVALFLAPPCLTYLYIFKKFGTKVAKGMISFISIYLILWAGPNLYGLYSCIYPSDALDRSLIIFLTSVIWLSYFFFTPFGNISQAKFSAKWDEMESSLIHFVENGLKLNPSVINKFDLNKATLEMTMEDFQKLSNQMKLQPETIVKLLLRYEDGNWKIKASRAIY